jgi:hypothetical protein
MQHNYQPLQPNNSNMSLDNCKPIIDDNYMSLDNCKPIIDDNYNMSLDNCKPIIDDNYNMSLYIPYISNKHLKTIVTDEKLSKYDNIRLLIHLKLSIVIGDIDRIDVLSKQTEKGLHYIAFVHFKQWKLDNFTQNIKYRLNNNMKTTITLDKDSYFILLKHNKQEQFNNPAFLLKIISNQENTINKLTNDISILVNNSDLQRKKQKL